VAAPFKELSFRIPNEACCECCVLSGRGLCAELITRPEKLSQMLCVVCDLETFRMRRSCPALGCSATEKKNYEDLILFYMFRSSSEKRRPSLRRDEGFSFLYLTTYYLLPFGIYLYRSFKIRLPGILSICSSHFVHSFLCYFHSFYSIFCDFVY